MGRPKKKLTQRGKPLTELQKSMIVQAYALCGNKSQVQREIGCSRMTVLKVLKEAETNKALQKARVSALEDVAGQVHGKTVDIIQSIGEQDLESGLIKKTDEDGKLLSVRAYGPSLLQKVTSAAILTDKLKVIEETKRAILEDGSGEASGELMLPGEVQASLRLLGKKITRLKMLDVQFAGKHEETAQRVQEVAQKAELHKDIEEADYEELDFDNPA